MRLCIITGLVLWIAVTCGAQTGQWSSPINTSDAPGYPNLLANGMMDSFAQDVATGWNPYSVNDNGQISFLPDPVNFDITPYSQALFGIESTALPANSTVAAGLYLQVAVTPGKHYYYVGYQDIYNEGFSAAGYRYVHNFGINTSGGTAPGTPAENGTIGGARWLPPGMAFWNKDSGGASTIGGFHRCMSAFTAETNSISLWSGVSIRTSGSIDPTPTRFNIDSNYLFEFDNAINTTGALINGEFETFVNLQNGGGGETPDTVPVGWAPCGGGIGQLQHISTDAYGARSGSYGLRLWNRRGVHNYGVMQRISTRPGARITFGCYAQGNAYCSASVGIDPNGGTDINNPGVLWSSTQSTVWTYISRTVTASGQAATLFLRNMFVSDVVKSHLAVFDSAAASWTIDGDATPPLNPTSCIDLNGSRSAVWQGTVSAPRFSWSGASDPESGIAGYYVYFGPSPAGTSTAFVTSASYTPGTASAGTSYLRVRSQNGESIPADDWKTIYEFKYDPTPPSAVVVTASGSYTSSISELSGSWTPSSDNESGVAFYEYGIGTTPGGVDITGWGQIDASMSVDKTGLSLTRGRKYYLTVRAVNAAGITGPASSSNGTWCAELPGSIGEAKSYPDGTPLILTGRKVSAVFLSDYWILDPDRTGGIRVKGTTLLTEGDSIDVGGLLSQVNGERVLQEPERNPQ